MAKVRKSISIAAPVDKVFNYIADPDNLPEIWPSLMGIKDVQHSPEGVPTNWGWTYKMAGMHFDGTSESVEYVANQRNVTTSRGGIRSTISWLYQPEDGGTKVTFEADYTVPVPLLGKLAESFIVRQNEKEAELILENLKARMET